MIIRTIDKQILLTLVSNYNWDPIPREVVDHWIKMHGKNITIEPEETDSSHTTRAPATKNLGMTPGHRTSNRPAARKSVRKIQNKITKLMRAENYLGSLFVKFEIFINI